MSSSQQLKPVGPTLAAALTKVKAEQDAKERLAEQTDTREEQARSAEKKALLSPCSQAVESGDVTPGHEGIKRKDRNTYHQPPGGYFEPRK